MNKTIRSSGREIIYKVYKRCLAEHEAQTILSDLDNIYQRTADMTEAAECAFQAINEEDWKNSCQHVIKIENEYCERELTMYKEIERLVINLEDDSSSTSESEYDSDEFLASSSQYMDMVRVEYSEEDLLQ